MLSVHYQYVISTTSLLCLCGYMSNKHKSLYSLDCPKNFANGILWEETASNSVASESCTIAGEQFRRGLVATRHCSPGGVWEPVDLTNCLLNEETSESATLWITLNSSSVNLDTLGNTVNFYISIITSV